MSADGKMQIFRGAEAADLTDTGVMSFAPASDEQQAGMANMIAAGYLDGSEVKLLVDLPGFSVTYIWFKKDYPLPLHSHDTDCLYCIIGGSLALGTETLGPRDSFFLPAGAPYTYHPGPEGVELLEIRHGGAFDFENLARNAAFYEKAIATIGANRDAWKAARRPTELADA